ncbi:MAG: hypothetical protein R3D81_16670 [Thalassovita sp.]
MPAEGTLLGKTRITGIVDKGESKGALLYSERELTEQGNRRVDRHGIRHDLRAWGWWFWRAERAG